MSRLVGSLVMALLAAGFSHEPQQPVFSARTSLVRVDVSVTERGKPVAGLRPSDFDVRDNGVRQQVDFVLAERMPLSVALVLDVSGSVAGERLDHFRSALDSVLGRLQKDDRVALVTFSHELSIANASSSDRDGLRTRLASARGSGGTSLFDASYAGLVLMDGSDERRLQVVFSDGLDTSSWLRPASVLEAAKRSQVVSYAVSTGNAVDDRFLRDLADLTGGSHLRISSTKEVGPAFAKILEEFRHRYLLSYRPQGVAAGGWHRIEVGVRRSGVVVKARTGYQFSQ